MVAGEYLEEAYPPLDFLGIKGFPHDCFNHDDLYEDAPIFNGMGESATTHISSFIKLVVEFNVFHEDDLMIIFACTLERDALEWFFWRSFPEKKHFFYH